MFLRKISWPCGNAILNFDKVLLNSENVAMLFFIEVKSSSIDIFASLLRKALIILFQQKPFYQKKEERIDLKEKKENEIQFSHSARQISRNCNLTFTSRYPSRDYKPKLTAWTPFIENFLIRR